MNILITGGAGFIGQHLTRSLLRNNVSVTILDNFLPQVHGENAALPPDIAKNARLVRGDVADPATLLSALDGVQRIVHLAAETGTGQSMYEVSRYAHTNLLGTAALFDLLTKNSNQAVDRVVVASSRAIYGEGAYECEQHGLIYPKSRTSNEKQAGIFDPICPDCKSVCTPAATPECAPVTPSSFYGLTKLTQEQTTLLFGNVLGIPAIALRYQNVFGPGQSLQNPYTGILAIFSNLARMGQPIQVFEDGMESRDFVYIDDVVAATTSAVLHPITGCHSINVGSGLRTTVLEVANNVNAFYGRLSDVHVTGAFREGDIRHGYADLTLARNLLQFHPQYGFHEGLTRFLSWAEESEPSTTRYEHSLAEMRSRGLLRD